MSNRWDKTKLLKWKDSKPPLLLLGTHRGVHDAGAVGSDGVGNVADVDGVQVLVVTCLLYEDLSESDGLNVRLYIYWVQRTEGEQGGSESHLVVEVVKVTWDKHMNVPHYLQNV